MTPARYPSLEGRAVFVTGGASGIGACLVESFAAQGARVAFVDIDAGTGRALADRLAAGSTAPLFLPCDIRDVAALQRAVAEAGDRLGDITVLLNNAASDDRHGWADVTPAYWDDRMAINQRPQFFAAQAVVPQMRRQGGGSIVNFGSITWKIGQGGMAAYSTAKAAVHGLTRSLARDLGPDNIRVNTLLPGAIETERQTRLWSTPDSEAAILAGQSLKFRLQPHHVASLALFLAAADSAGCTAQEFTVDGGWV